MDDLKKALLGLVGAEEADTQPVDGLTQEELLGMIVDTQYQIALMQMGVEDNDG